MPSRLKRKRKYFESPRTASGCEEEAVAHALAWLNDSRAVETWIAQRAPEGLTRLLAGGAGFARLRNFLPPRVAEGVRLALDRLPPKAWERDSKDTHSFATSEVEGDAVLLGAARALARLMPETLPNFAAASYGIRDGIPPHDDVATELRTEIEVRHTKLVFETSDLSSAAAEWRVGSEHRDNAIAAGSPKQSFCRVVAAIYQLSRGWKASFGGELIDHETKQRHVPEFNTLVLFKVPRLHEVSPVRAPKEQFRRSIFGWFLKPKLDASTPLRLGSDLIEGTQHTGDVTLANPLPKAMKKRRKRKTSRLEHRNDSRAAVKRRKKNKENAIKLCAISANP